jgi:hypothetical protein
VLVCEGLGQAVCEGIGQVRDGVFDIGVWHVAQGLDQELGEPTDT